MKGLFFLFSYESTGIELTSSFGLYFLGVSGWGGIMTSSTFWIFSDFCRDYYIDFEEMREIESMFSVFLFLLKESS